MGSAFAAKVQELWINVKLPSATLSIRAARNRARHDVRREQGKSRWRPSPVPWPARANLVEKQPMS
jgi:hypothetical protein